MILVKHPEAGAREFGWVAVGEKLLVNAQKARLCQLPIRAILSKSLVPFFNLALGDYARLFAVVFVWLFSSSIYLVS